jgi:PAS domain S-box-containing protein
MRVRLLPAAAAAVAAVVLFTGWLWLLSLLRLGDGPPDAWAPNALALAPAVAVLAAGVGAVAVGGVHFYYRRLFRALAERVAAVQKNPSLTTLRAPPPGDGLGELLARLDGLAGAYRQALAAVVAAQQRLDLLGDGAADRGDRGPLPARYVVGAHRRRMIARLTPNLYWIAATTPLQKFLGCAIDDLVARSFLDAVHPADAPALRATLQEALKEGEGHDVRFRVLVPAGRPDKADAGGPPQAERFLQMDVMTCYEEAGEPLNFRCHFTDVTDRVLTERALRRRTEEVSQANARLRQANADLRRLKESYHDLYHNAPVLYFSLDARGRFAACNDTMVRTLGYAREELIGRPYTLLLTPAGRGAFLADPAAFQRPGEVEAQWVQKDGAVIDVWVGSTAVKDGGVFVRSRSAALDVTERKRLGDALRGQAAELEQANARLRRTNQELEDFTYVVSHDLKEPLRTLEAFSTFLAQDYGPALGAEGREHIGHLIGASRRLGALIDDLLALSRAGRVIHAPRAFSWDEVVEVVLSDLHDLIQRKQAAVRVAGPLPPVAGDPERVMQLLANLFANALKYNPGGRPEAVLGAVGSGEWGVGSEKPEGEAAASHSPLPTPYSPLPFATLYVRDNGAGIDPQYHEQIFRMFRRLHRGDEVEGTGAGLAICKKIVEAHGGRIWVESAAGRGATFYFTLPQLPADRPAARRDEAAVAAAVPVG